jgi:CubicO group peptidase (beta-lactamase class C family)
MWAIWIELARLAPHVHALLLSKERLSSYPLWTNGKITLNLLKPLYILPLLALACAQEQTVEIPQSFGELDHYLASEIEEGRLKGVHGLVFHNGAIVFDRFYGHRDSERSDPMQGNEQYYLKSMTKPIMSVAAMILVEEGLISLDDPVGMHLPQFASPSVAINIQEGSKGGAVAAQRQPTIRELLSHTSGLSHGLMPTGLDMEIWQKANAPEVRTLADRLHALSQLPLTYEPGTRWHYSFSPDLLAGVIEKVTGQSVDQFLQERIFTPLEMRNTGYNLDELQASRLQVVHDFMPDSTLQPALEQISPSGNTLYAGNDNLFSTTYDYLLFARMLLGKGELNGVRILKPETVALMTTDATAGLGGRSTKEDVLVKLATAVVVDKNADFTLEPGYGFGLGFGVLLDSFAADRPNVPNGEFLWSGAYSTHFFINPEMNLIGVFMTQIGWSPNPNPYLFYFGDQMRRFTYLAFKPD